MTRLLLLALGVCLATSAPAQIVYSNNCEGVVGAEWSNRKTEVTPVGGRRFLGQFASQTVTLTLGNLPPHSSATITFDLFLIQSWDGNDPANGPDLWGLSVTGGPTLLRATFGTHNLVNNQVTNRTQAFPGNYPSGRYPVLTGASEVNTLGYFWNWVGVLDAVYHLTFTFPHSANQVQFNFAGQLNGTGVGDESWGLANIVVSVANLTSNAPPQFVLEPQSQAVLGGDNVLLTAQAQSGSPVQYQWQYNDTDVPGATNAYLVLTNVAAPQAGSYTVKAANGAGTINSAPAYLAVVQAPTRSLAVIEGTNVSFSATVAGASPIGYRWLYNDREIPGATNQTLVLAAVTAAQTGNYALSVETPFGSVRTPPFKLTVATLINRPVYQSDFQQIVVGPEWSNSKRVVAPRDRRRFLGLFGSETVSLTLGNLPPHTELNLALDLLLVLNWDGNAAPPDGPDVWRVQASGLPALFQSTFTIWPDHEQCFPGGYPGVKYRGRTGAAELGTLGYQAWPGSMVDYASGFNNLDAVYNLNFQFQHTNSTLTLNFSGANLEGLATEAWGLNNVVVSVAQVPANAPPYLTSAPRNQFVRAGEPVAFQAGGTVETSLTYQWRFSGADLPGQTNSYLVLPQVDGNQAGLYSVTIANAYGSVSRPAQLSVLTRDPVGESVNVGDTAVFLTAAEPASVQYQWRLNGRDLPGRTNPNLNFFTTTNSPGIYQVLANDGVNSLLSLVAGLSVGTSGQPGSVQWIAYQGTSYWATPAVAPDGTVYAGDMNGHLYAMTSRGDSVWQLSLPGMIFSSPVVGSDGRVYVVAGQTLYAINRLGVILWQTGSFADGRPTSIPCLGPGGTVYLTGGLDHNANPHFIEAIAADGVARWTYRTAGNTLSSAALAADGSLVFAVNNPNEFVALQNNGATKWLTTIPNAINAAPALGADGTIYGTAWASIFAVNPTNGARRWTFSTASQDLMLSSPVVDEEGVVYVGSDEGKLFAMDPGGTPRWVFRAGAPIHSTPAISAAGSIYFTAYDGNLYCVGKNGTERWQAAISQPIPHPLQNWFQASPVIAADGMIYAATREGRIWKFRGDAGPAASAWPQLHRDAQHRGSLATDTAQTVMLKGASVASPGQFSFQVTTAPGRYVAVFSSTDLQHWEWYTNLYSVTGAAQIRVPLAPQGSAQFYRAAVP